MQQGANEMHSFAPFVLRALYPGGPLVPTLLAYCQLLLLGCLLERQPTQRKHRQVV